MTQDTSMGGPGRRFPSTSWATLGHLRSQDPAGREEALRRLIEAYWKPVYCYIRQAWGRSNEDAKDLTQDFFAEIVIQGAILDRVDASRGSFRSYLKRAVANFVRDAAKAAGRQKRGGDKQIRSLSLEAFDVGSVVRDTHALTPEQVFDAAWRHSVLARAVEALERRLRTDGKAAYFEVLRRYDLDPESPEVSYKSIGEQMGLNPETVKFYLMRAREEFRTAVMDVVSDYVDNEADLFFEINELFGI